MLLNRMICRCLRVSPSGYYGWCGRPLSPRAEDNQRLLERIREMHAQSDGVLGADRIRDDLHDEGERCGLNRVARLMRVDGLQGIPCKRKLRSKTSGTRPSDVENQLARDFSADAPNTKWATFITYIRIAGGVFLYLCVVIDLYSGIVVGWSMSRCEDRQLVLQAVLMALWQCESRQPVILHSDRGCQFTSVDYQRFLNGHNLTCSMGGVGSCADNAACECFYNPRRRRKLEVLKLKKSNLTQPSVISG